MEGFVKLPRTLFHTFLWAGGRLSRFEAYLDLLRRAAFHPSVARLRLGAVRLEPGELICSQDTLAAAWGWSKGAVSKYLRDLIGAGLVNRFTRDGQVLLAVHPEAATGPPAGGIVPPAAQTPLAAPAPGSAPPVNRSKNRDSKNSFLNSEVSESKEEKEFLEPRDTEPEFARYVAEVMQSGRKLRFDRHLMPTLRAEWEARRRNGERGTVHEEQPAEAPGAPGKAKGGP